MANWQKREYNRIMSKKMLTKAEIPFREFNAGAHLKLEDGQIDFWPGTGLWKDTFNSIEGRGVQMLIDYMRGGRNEMRTDLIDRLNAHFCGPIIHRQTLNVIAEAFVDEILREYYLEKKES